MRSDTLVLNLVLTASLVGCGGSDQVECLRQANSPDAGRDLAKESAVELGNHVKLEMVLIPAGEFMMGTAAGEEEVGPTSVFMEQPKHRVRITKPFYLGKFEVTQEQWSAVMRDDPSRFIGPRNPVERVTWSECRGFLAKLNAKFGASAGEFRLPTEAEWEYACRAGSTTKYCFGDDDDKLAEFAWFGAGLDGATHPVGQKTPNAWGLFDMHGNVFEVVADVSDPGYYAVSPTDDPPGPSWGWTRQVRGGSWRSDAHGCYSADRHYHVGTMGGRSYQVGLRIARTAVEGP